MSIKARLIGAALFGIAAAVTPLHAGTTPPAPIVDLTVSPGDLDGSIELQWTATGDDGTVGTATRYEIYYLFNEPINAGNLDDARRIDAPPLNVSVSTPQPSGTAEELIVTGLEPGSVYGFAIKAFDDGNLSSNLSNSATTQATLPCLPQPGDGDATASTLPSSIAAGEPFATTTTVTVGASGIAPGGLIQLRIPDGWIQPSTATFSDEAGFVALPVTNNGSATLTASTSGQFINIVVGGGGLSGGDTVSIYYLTESCAVGETRELSVFTRAGACGVAKKVPSGSVSTVTGPPAFIGFPEWPMAAILGNVTKMTLRARDWCGFETTLAAEANVTLAALGEDFLPDPSASVSASASPFTSTQTILTAISTGASSQDVYYKATSSGRHRLKIQYPNYDEGEGTIDVVWDVDVIGEGIKNVSVDTGNKVAGQTAVTFTPDGDGSADTAFINFELPQSANWRVDLSSDGFATVARQFFGNQKQVRIAWNGFRDGQPGEPPRLAAPATFAVKIVMGGTIENTDATLTLQTNGVTGIVEEQSDDTPVPVRDVDVHLFGPSRAFARTDAAGRFTAYGLKTGTYQLEIRRVGYGTLRQTININAGINDIGAKELEKQSVLRLAVTRPSAASLPELWGRVTAHSNDWSRSSDGTIHFGPGKTISDAGDLWNVVPTTYTSLSLAPGVTYFFRLEVPSHAATTTVSVALNPGETRDLPFALARRPNISGNVAFSQPVTNDTWVSVEAGPDANADGVFDTHDPLSFYWGGAHIPAGGFSGKYEVFGVTDGTYALRARAPGFVTESASVTVSGTNATVNFSTFSQGGVLTGTITVNGDTTALGQGGTFQLPIGARSQSGTNESYGEILLAADAESTSGSYTLSGLEDGVFDLFVWLPGFESNPPGRITATVSGGDGSLDVTLNQHTGVLTGEISLPPGATTYDDVKLSLRPDFGGSGGGPSPEADIFGSTYRFDFLGSGPYELVAISDTGLRKSGQVFIVNGQTTTLNLDLSADTLSISGRVTTSARSPYNTLPTLVDDSDDTILFINQAAIPHRPNRIVAVRMDFDRRGGGDEGGPDHSEGTSGIEAARIVEEEFLWAEYDEDTGTYTITNVSPGTYRVFNNGELDNNFTNGLEIAEVSRILHVYGADATEVDFNLIDGWKVSGTVRVNDGTDDPGRRLILRLQDAGGLEVAESEVFLTGTSASFAFERIAAGAYTIALDDPEQPKKYAAESVNVTVNGSDVSGFEVRLLRTGKIRGQLRLADSNELLTSVNYQNRIPDSFIIEARSNPWIQGGWGRADFPIIDSAGYFNVSVPPGTYDVIMRASGHGGIAEVSAGKKQFVPITMSGLEVGAGQTLDLGVVDLQEGTFISGTVTDVDGMPLENIPIEARPLGTTSHDDFVRALTNAEGGYTLFGIDTDGIRYYEVEAAYRDDRSSPSDFASNLAPYGSVLKEVDTQAEPVVDFVLERALGSVRGVVQTPDGGALEIPFGDGGDGQVGAVVIVNKQGNIPQDNPLGDIQTVSAPDGSFTIKGLVPGTYDLWALGAGYGSGVRTNISIADSEVDVGTVTMQTGFKMSGTITKRDGSSPNTSELETLVGFGQTVIVGNLTTDAAGSILGYSISGFQPNQSYAILGFNETDDLHVLASGVQLTSDEERNFVLGEQTPTILTSARKSESSIIVQYEFSRPLRNSEIDLDGNGEADDSEPEKIISCVTCDNVNGLAFSTNWLSSDRRRATVTYTPAAGEGSFSLQINAVFVSKDAATGENQSQTETTTFFLGINKLKSERIVNANGGSIRLENDSSKFSAAAGGFTNASSTNSASLVVDVIMRSADTADSLTAQQAPLGVSALAIAKGIGMQSYPSEMASAMTKVGTLGVDPLSTFYDIFLPAGVNHFFPEGKEAQICLQYDESVSDPSTLNIYYYNAATNEYVLEGENRLVDTENRRICASISHASVFTVFASSASVITGDGYTGDLAVMNFPNPFDLKSKTVSLQNPGTENASQTIQGTMIKYSVPASLSGAVEIEIYNVLGEKVRTLNSHVATGGSHFYLEWDGTNDAGRKVASGTYIARFSIGGGNEKFFKMAVVK